MRVYSTESVQCEIWRILLMMQAHSKYIRDVGAKLCPQGLDGILNMRADHHPPNTNS